MTGKKPRVAAIVTEYRPRSHADVIVSKLLADYTHPAPRPPVEVDFNDTARQLLELPLPLDEHGRLKAPRVDVVSMFTDQVPANDISREWAGKYDVPIFDTVREALTLGGSSLAVDGIVLIGEHGDYPTNARGQKEYPRRRLFDACLEVMQESGRFVPLFNDKHLGFAWQDAKHMYDASREHGFALGAGSSISVCPVGWRYPAYEVPLGARIEQAFTVGHGGLESYGFHTLEVLQCQVERRAGGETGVAAVQALRGDAVWEAAEQGRWDRALLDAAIGTLETPLDGDVRSLAKDPVIYLIEYRDGLKAACAMLAGVSRNWIFSARLTPPSAAQPEVVATRFRAYHSEPFGHFAWLCEEIQDLIVDRREPHPVERTLLTTGILDRLMESLSSGGTRLETPELDVRYKVSG
ncbi:MAG TPA: hypothetical protein VFN74_05540 [Chloroflexota bacterium]|nr:hypothetical protein [Chloroflexota bacterium]